MKLRTAATYLLLAALAACATAPGPVAPEVPVPAGNGYVWVLKDAGHSALWGPPASEAVFALVCDPASGESSSGEIRFQYFGLPAPSPDTDLRIEADGRAGIYPAQVQRNAMGDYLAATTPASDPFLQHMLQAGQWRVHAAGQTLLIGVVAETLRPVLQACGA